VIAQYKKPL